MYGMGQNFTDQQLIMHSSQLVHLCSISLPCFTSIYVIRVSHTENKLNRISMLCYACCQKNAYKESMTSQSGYGQFSYAQWGRFLTRAAAEPPKHIPRLNSVIPLVELIGNFSTKFFYWKMLITKNGNCLWENGWV